MDNASQPGVTNETNELDAKTCNGLAKKDNVYQSTPSQTPSVRGVGIYFKTVSKLFAICLFITYIFSTK